MSIRVDWWTGKGGEEADEGAISRRGGGGGMARGERSRWEGSGCCTCMRLAATGWRQLYGITDINYCRMLF